MKTNWQFSALAPIADLLMSQGEIADGKSNRRIARRACVAHDRLSRACGSSASPRSAISDKRATTSLIEHAQEFDKKAEAIATEIVLLAHSECRQTDSRERVLKTLRPEEKPR